MNTVLPVVVGLAALLAVLLAAAIRILREYERGVTSRATTFLLA